MCENDGGEISSVPANNAGGTEICSASDINEEWPVLPADLYEKGYSYALDDPEDPAVLIGTMPETTDTIECSISTGSCTTVVVPET
jgi:hypothetical protein